MGECAQLEVQGPWPVQLPYIRLNIPYSHIAIHYSFKGTQITNLNAHR